LAPELASSPLKFKTGIHVLPDVAPGLEELLGIPRAFLWQASRLPQIRHAALLG